MVQECLNCIELRKRIAELEEKYGVPQVFEGACWKGVDEVIVTRVDGGWVYENHNKSKKTRKVYSGKHFITDEDLSYIKKLFYSEFKKGNNHFKKGYFYDKIISDKHLPLSHDNFAGGRNRNKYYFVIFYYPIKILEFQGLIEYDGVIDFTDKLIKEFKGGLHG